jgi:hypothetical protein
MKRYCGNYEVFDIWSNEFIDGFMTEERARAYVARNEPPPSSRGPRYIVLPVRLREGESH